KNDSAEEVFPRQMAVQYQRQPEAEPEFQDGCSDSVEDRVEDGEQENAIVPQQLVVFEADEDARPAEPGVRKGKPHAEAERVREEDEQENRSWKEKEKPQHIAALAQVDTQPASGCF